jgi:hypothetical protein
MVMVTLSSVRVWRPEEGAEGAEGADVSVACALCTWPMRKGAKRATGGVRPRGRELPQLSPTAPHRKLPPHHTTPSQTHPQATFVSPPQVQHDCHAAVCSKLLALAALGTAARATPRHPLPPGPPRCVGLWQDMLPPQPPHRDFPWPLANPLLGSMGSASYLRYCSGSIVEQGQGDTRDCTSLYARASQAEAQGQERSPKGNNKSA